MACYLTKQVINRWPVSSPGSVSGWNDLRQLIIRKNELYFHQYRPANETYLFGFRKHEQGNNAVEMPKFTPLIEELDRKINEGKKGK